MLCPTISLVSSGSLETKYGVHRPVPSAAVWCIMALSLKGFRPKINFSGILRPPGGLDIADAEPAL